LKITDWILFVKLANNILPNAFIRLTFLKYVRGKTEERYQMAAISDTHTKNGLALTGNADAPRHV